MTIYFVTRSSKVFSARRSCLLFVSELKFLVFYLYTVNHKKRDILFLTITLASLNRFL